MKRLKEFARINTLESTARTFHTRSATDEEIEDIEITDLTMNEIPYTLKSEILNICIHGKTRSSKSTLMLWLLKHISEKHLNKPIELWQICAEQFEFTRKVTYGVKDERTGQIKEVKNTIMGIDEAGQLETSGANATMDEKMLEQFSDLNAQKEIHRIYCSPRTTLDKNSNILIKIMSKDKERFLTHCLIYYKVEAPNEWYIQLIGRASFYIKDIMFGEKEWKKLKEEYKEDWEEYKNEYSNEDGFWAYILNKYENLQRIESEFEPTKDKNGRTHKPFGEHYTDIYYRYRKRKFLKMNLLQKEGVARMRDMVFAEIALASYKELEDLCGITSITKDNIEAEIDIKLMEIKYPLTIYAMEVIKSKVAALISYKKTIQQLKMKMIKTRIGPDRIRIEKAIERIQINLNKVTKELERLIEVNKKYNEI